MAVSRELFISRTYRKLTLTPHSRKKSEAPQVMERMIETPPSGLKVLSLILSKTLRTEQKRKSYDNNGPKAVPNENLDKPKGA